MHICTQHGCKMLTVGLALAERMACCFQTIGKPRNTTGATQLEDLKAGLYSTVSEYNDDPSSVPKLASESSGISNFHIR
jgi:hypothetical protein